jgi:hypothetical protein
MLDLAATRRKMPVSYCAPTMFTFRQRGVRSVAMSDNLIAMVDCDGIARSLKFIPDPEDPTQARIAYAVADGPEFTLLAGQVGPVWATFDHTAASFRRKAFPDQEARWMKAVIVLSAIFMVLAGTWSVMTARPRSIVQVDSQSYDAPTRKFDL